MSSPPSIIFTGAGEFGLPALTALLKRGDRIVQVVSQPDRPAGRGRKLAPTAIAAFAIEHQLPLLRTENINNESLPPADLMVVIAFGQKIAPHIVKHAQLGSINLHASRLPKFRGAAPIQAAMLAGEAITGNSVIRLAEKMDAGAVLGMSELTIGELETGGELHDRLAADGAILLPRVVDELIAGRAIETPQDDSQATLAPKLKRESARIDWNESADLIARCIRAFHPWPACRVRILENGRELHRATFVRARPALATDPRPAASIDSRGFIACGNAAVEIVELQPEGGRIMSLDAYGNGYPWRAGLVVESI